MLTNNVNTTLAATPNTYTEDAQARLLEVRQMRPIIPHLAIPQDPNATRRLASAASVAPEFIELSAVAIANEKDLAREGVTPAELRDLAMYADAYEPLADELEALAQFVRHSVTAARNRVGRMALTTYGVAKRMARNPEYAHLAPYVADMRRALGRVRKLSPEVLAQRAAKKAAKTQQQEK